MELGNTKSYWAIHLRAPNSLLLGADSTTPATTPRDFSDIDNDQLEYLLRACPEQRSRAFLAAGEDARHTLLHPH